MEGEEVKREVSSLTELKREIFEYSLKFYRKTLKNSTELIFNKQLKSIDSNIRLSSAPTFVNVLQLGYDNQNMIGRRNNYQFKHNWPVFWENVSKLLNSGQ